MRMHKCHHSVCVWIFLKSRYRNDHEWWIKTHKWYEVEWMRSKKTCWKIALRCYFVEKFLCGSVILRNIFGVTWLNGGFLLIKNLYFNVINTQIQDITKEIITQFWKKHMMLLTTFRHTKMEYINKHKMRNDPTPMKRNVIAFPNWSGVMSCDLNLLAESSSTCAPW